MYRGRSQINKYRIHYLLYRVIIFILGPSCRVMHLPCSSRCVVGLLPFPPSTCDLFKAVNLTRKPLLSTPPQFKRNWKYCFPQESKGRSRQQELQPEWVKIRPPSLSYQSEVFALE